MRVEIHVYHHCDPAVLAAIADLKETLMTTQQEVAAALNSATAQITKIGNETRTLLTKIDDLTTAINAGGNATPEVETALAALQDQVTVVDGLVPDVADSPAPAPAPAPSDSQS